MLDISKLSTTKVVFPSTANALIEPNGLLAMGGNLNADTLINAYRQGIFPWFNIDEPILWWSPNPRMVLYLDQLHIAKSLQKLAKKNKYQITIDTQFNKVITKCAEVRANSGTWINPQMIRAYNNLHQLGYAHSIEVCTESELVGGLYGVAFDQVFFGESMFSIEANTSKLALIKLVATLQAKNFKLIDCQQQTSHLESMGACSISRKHFSELLTKYCNNDNCGKW
jgi:leucyl/phenylalanyl-tRNA--protein transferase